jgi:hypothetical protein
VVEAAVPLGAVVTLGLSPASRRRSVLAVAAVGAVVHRRYRAFADKPPAPHRP